MSTLTYANPGYAAPHGKDEAAKRKSFWRRLYEALQNSQQRRAEIEIARYLRGHGGLLTDDMEREIMDRLSGRPGGKAY
jgi:hypothetical protein